MDEVTGWMDEVTGMKLVELRDVTTERKKMKMACHDSS